MTSVTFTRTAAGYEVRMRGHAGYSDGDDIVCASCSILAYALAENVLRMQDELHTSSVSTGDGEMTICAGPRSKRLDIIMDAYQAGYELLSQKYPQNVVLTPKRGRNKKSDVLR